MRCCASCGAELRGNSRRCPFCDSRTVNHDPDDSDARDIAIESMQQRHGRKSDPKLTD